MTATPDPERVAQLEHIHLAAGGHDNPDHGMCAMEAAAWIAGEPFSDHPTCVDPVIATFLRTWNDGLPDDETRDRLLKDLIPLTIGTASTPDKQDRRAMMAADWAVRTYTPAWLRLAGLTDHADTLAGLPVLDTVGAFHAARTDPLAAAGVAAGDAAWDAAGAAVRAAARAAARAVARAAAGAAAGAVARDAVGFVAGAVAVAGDVAGDAAWAAARDAARAGAAVMDALAPTVAELQASARDLVVRMCTL